MVWLNRWSLAGVAFIAYLTLSSGQGPLYADIRVEMDSFSTRMKRSFEGFTNVLQKFDSKLEKINSSLRTDVLRVNDSVSDVEGTLQEQLGVSEARTDELENMTNTQVAELRDKLLTMQKDSAKVKSQILEGHDASRDILKKLEVMKKDFKSFQRKMTSLLRTKFNTSAIMSTLNKNREDIINEIDNLSQNMTCARTDDLRPLQSSIDRIDQGIDEMKQSLLDGGSGSDCTSGWTRFENSCYRFVNQSTSWKLAKFMCREYGSFLLEMYSQQEVELLSTFMKNSTEGTELWTGASIGKKGIWYWSGSKTEVNFDQFKGDYPSGRVRQYCATFKPNYQNLEDHNCGKRYTFVCRKFHFNI